MTEQDFLKLLKEVAKKAKPFHNELKPIDDMDMVFTDAGLVTGPVVTCNL